MNKIKKSLLFYMLLNIAFFAILALLAVFVKDLTTGTVFQLLSPWFLYSISFFILAGDYQPAYLPAKRLNWISAILRGGAVIVAYCCVGFHTDKVVYICLLSTIGVMFGGNLLLDLLSARVIKKYLAETEKIFLQNVETVTEEDIKNIGNYRKAIGKAMGGVFGCIVSIGLFVGIGISLGLFRDEPLNAGTVIFMAVEVLIVIYCAFIAYKNLIVRTKLFFTDAVKRKKRLRIELIFLTAAYLMAIGNAVIDYLDSSIQFLPFITSVVFLVPIFRTNRRIAVKVKLTEAKIRADREIGNFGF